MSTQPRFGNIKVMNVTCGACGRRRFVSTGAQSGPHKAPEIAHGMCKACLARKKESESAAK